MVKKGSVARSVRECFPRYRNTLTYDLVGHRFYGSMLWQFANRKAVDEGIGWPQLFLFTLGHFQDDDGPCVAPT
jgi:hypothetical protein